jgi:hypothetical protein
VPAITKLEPLLGSLKISRFVAKSLDALIVDVIRNHNERQRNRVLACSKR